jgi:hypothetical protein
MPIRRFLPLIAIMALLVPSLVAGGLSKYKDWPSSPQGYFMTGAERAAWKANVKTDADAEQFVNKFLASRGPGFADDVAKSAEMADKHLTVGSLPGSRTLRGKIVIVLGPPSTFNVAGRQLQSGRAGSLGGITGGGASGGGKVGNKGGGIGDSGASVSNMVDATNQSSMAASTVKDYTFTYAADKLPGKPAQGLEVVVEVNPSDGSDKITDRKVAAQLDEIFERAAAARLASPKP